MVQNIKGIKSYGRSLFLLRSLMSLFQGVTKQSNEVTSNEVTENRVAGKISKGQKFSNLFKICRID